MTERRYDDDEVAAIFANAADTREVTRRTSASATGMTLAELQEIGREVGLSPEAVARAASQLERTAPTATSRRFLGLPIGVGQTVELAVYPRSSCRHGRGRGAVRCRTSLRGSCSAPLQAPRETSHQSHHPRR
ncbi:MAG: hypothetical protein WEF86_00565 [Gemmatimonadota bacterium]